MSEHTHTSYVFSLSASTKINQPIDLRQVALSSPETGNFANIMKPDYSGWEAHDLEAFYSLVSVETCTVPEQSVRTKPQSYAWARWLWSCKIKAALLLSNAHGSQWLPWGASTNVLLQLAKCFVAVTLQRCECEPCCLLRSPLLSCPLCWWSFRCVFFYHFFEYVVNV